MGPKRTDEFRQDAVRIALTSGLPLPAPNSSARPILPMSGIVKVQPAHCISMMSARIANVAGVA